MDILDPLMTPAPGDRGQRFVGDQFTFHLRDRHGRGRPKGWRALLRTNLGRADVLRREILQAHTHGLPLGGESWRDLPMQPESGSDGWVLELPLTEVGFFKAKAYLVDPDGWQHWPAGPDFGLSVHPDQYRTANTLYCAFARLFGQTRSASRTGDAKREAALAAWDQLGYTVIPPSGKLRDLIPCLPHIIDRLGCRVLHLLPVNPTPTTYARFGRFGSPYAAQDLTAIDPALVVFDQRTTGVDQFRELTYAVHQRGGRVLLDIVINHTGWGAVLQETHPEWYLRLPDGRFASPGAWGTTWEDLVELKHQHVALWDELADMFLIWCRRGVDGFRCDAGYKVPVPAWQYIVARVQQEYPEALFFLEGLGGAWEATEALLTEGGMQWAYSELFQNYSGEQVSSYLDHGFRQAGRVGLLLHYSETHDNPRLAERGAVWSLLRNRLCALTSVGGGFGFTCGVEWLAEEKIRVHGCTGLAWGNAKNLVPELARLNALLAEHPCFFDGAKLTRLSPANAPVLALLRESAEGKDAVLVLVNTDPDQRHSLPLPALTGAWAVTPACDFRLWTDLLGQPLPVLRHSPAGEWTFQLEPGAAFCLAPSPTPRGLCGGAYRRARGQAAWGLVALSRLGSVHLTRALEWRELAAAVERSAAAFLAAASALPAGAAAALIPSEIDSQYPERVFPRVVIWTLADCRRVTLVPPGHWLLLEDTVRFRATLECQDGGPLQNVESIPAGNREVACFAPRHTPGEATLRLERYAEHDQQAQAAIRFLAAEPQAPTRPLAVAGRQVRAEDSVLLTNGRGGMARLCVDLGRVQSKYDCVLGANLHPSLPVDRHIFAKRIRVWVNADGFISPLDFRSLVAFTPGPPAVWDFVANAGDGRTVEIQICADMLPERNSTLFHFRRPTAAQATGKQLPLQADVRLTVRLDIEDRGFHGETKRNGGAEFHFSSYTHTLATHASAASDLAVGFAFRPSPDRQLRVFTSQGRYHAQPEWSEGLPHPVEQSRGQVGCGDAFSPGWFDLPLPKGAEVTLMATADPQDTAADLLEASKHQLVPPCSSAAFAPDDHFGQHLLRIVRAFVVRRGEGKTVIAGYPWFLDWGRDTFICARGLLAAGMVDEVKQLVLTFARFERNGTLPNTIFGEDASNRDTSDAPLWFALVCEELAQAVKPAQPAPGEAFYQMPVDGAGRTLGDVLESIALNYIQGTSNGIRMDSGSALIWSPSHFTWMDTNYPAGTPREGYPIEIQALWIRLLRQLERVAGRPARAGWEELAAQAQAALERLFWLEPLGYYTDVLRAPSGQPATKALAEDALRGNCLLLVSLGLTRGLHAKRCVAAAARHLVVPGALRSLAPLPVCVPQPIHAADGRLLNNPLEPYWGRYEGDEDTRRKPAYHNGTAWTWPFPGFCEALARAWEFTPASVEAAKAYLGSLDRLIGEGCLGHIPEIVDGDTPHRQRGCDAQAWGATEALRVWKLLQEARKTD